MSVDISSQWRKFVVKHVQNSTERFTKCQSEEERLALCWKTFNTDTSFHPVVHEINTEVKKLKGKYSTRKVSEEKSDSLKEETQTVLPQLAKEPHPKISNGSSLIQINSSVAQGRYLQARDNIKAGDVLILEKPYAAVLVPENKDTHCSHCFKLLERNTFTCPVCQTNFCCVLCWENAWQQYHEKECCLQPLFQMLDISSHLALRLLLVTGKENLLNFLKELKDQKIDSKPKFVPGFTVEGMYSGDYACVYNLVTNTEQQSVQALFSYAMDSALIVDVAFDFLYGPQCTSPCHQVEGDEMTRDVMGSLLLHHMQQMPCNIHAVIAIVNMPDPSKSGVTSKEQRRIAAGIYPTASLMNHACDPDVIVSFLGQHLVVRATHNIKPNEEIAHCYGPSASRMSREVRQNLLQKQYFFTCGCNACKNDEDLEEQSFYSAEFLCQKCSGAVVVSRDENTTGKCTNKNCANVQQFTAEIKTVKDGQSLFNKAMQSLETDNYDKAIITLKECLKKFQSTLYKFDKNVAETHDALARCYASLGDFRQASFHCEHSTETVRRRFGSESIEYGHELHKFSQLLFNGKQVNKAKTIIDKAVYLLTLHYGAQYDEVEELQQMKKTLDEL